VNKLREELNLVISIGAFSKIRNLHLSLDSKEEYPPNFPSEISREIKIFCNIDSTADLDDFVIAKGSQQGQSFFAPESEINMSDLPPLSKKNCTERVDPIWGPMYFPDYVLEIIDNPYFQALTFNFQGIDTRHVWHDISYSLYCHSIGVYHVGRLFLVKASNSKAAGLKFPLLEKKDLRKVVKSDLFEIAISEAKARNIRHESAVTHFVIDSINKQLLTEGIKIFLAACLLHNVGILPHSYLVRETKKELSKDLEITDYLSSTEKSLEVIFRQKEKDPYNFFTILKDKWKIKSPSRIATILLNSPNDVRQFFNERKDFIPKVEYSKNEFLKDLEIRLDTLFHNIFHSVISPNELDYLLRDNYHGGANLAPQIAPLIDNIDFSRFSSSPGQLSDFGCLDTGIIFFENFFKFKSDLFKKVYWGKETRSATILYKILVEEFIRSENGSFKKLFDYFDPGNNAVTIPTFVQFVGDNLHIPNVKKIWEEHIRNRNFFKDLIIITPLRTKQGDPLQELQRRINKKAVVKAIATYLQNEINAKDELKFLQNLNLSFFDFNIIVDIKDCVDPEFYQSHERENKIMVRSVQNKVCQGEISKFSKYIEEIHKCEIIERDTIVFYFESSLVKKMSHACRSSADFSHVKQLLFSAAKNTMKEHILITKVEEPEKYFNFYDTL
jgi:HD superfamily phosphohydrolase